MRFERDTRVGLHMINGRFFLLHTFLLLLYLWTLGEELPIQIRVNRGVCEAFAGNDSIQVACPDLQAGVQIGLYLEKPPLTAENWFTVPPIEWLIHDSAWESVAVVGGRTAVFAHDGLAGWQVLTGGMTARWGEIRALWPNSVMLWQGVETADFTVQATLRRANSAAGILLLQPGGQRGLVFLFSGRDQSGLWWEWENGQLTRSLTGIPMRKPLFLQLQTTLRVFLRAHQGAILLWGVVWVLSFPFALAKKQLPLRLPPTKWVLWVVVWSIFALTLHLNLHILQQLPHAQDSLTYLFQAKTVARGALWAPAPPLPHLFAQEFLLVQNGRWFGKYPPGYPAVLAVGVWLQAPWIINPFLAVLTIPLLYQLAACLYHRRMGLLTAVLCLGSPFFWLLSADMMAHAAELFWLTLFMVAWLCAFATWSIPRRATVWLLLAGCAAGAAFLTRQLSAIVIVAGFILPFLLVRRGIWQNGRFYPFIWFLSPLILALVLLLGYQAAVTENPWQDPRLLYWQYDRLGFGPTVGEKGNTIQAVPFGNQFAQVWSFDPARPPRGHTLENGLHNITLNWQELARMLFNLPPFLTLSLAWLVFVAKRPSYTDFSLLLLVLLLTSAHLFYWHNGIFYGPRYLYAALPAFLLLTARGIRALWGVGRETTAVLFTILALGSLFTTPDRLARYQGYNFISGEDLHNVETAVSTPALVFVTRENGDWWEYGALFPGNSPWLDSPIIFARDSGTETNHQLITLFPERQVYYFHQGILKKE